MRFKNFEEFTKWFKDEVRSLPNGNVLVEISSSLDIFGPKKNIVDNVEFIIKGDYDSNIIKSVYENAVNHDQELIEFYINKVKTGNYKDLEITIGCLVNFVTCIYHNYFILEVASK